MGEFPWQVRVGETVQVKDYISPPGAFPPKNPRRSRLVGSATYTPRRDIWKAFGLKGSPPPVTGIYANQPSPYQGKSGSAWSVFVLLTLLLLTHDAGRHRSAQSKSLSAALHLRVGSGRTIVRYSCFHLEGRESNVEVTVNTDLNNDWAYLSLALINEDTGVAYDFGKEISYYFGRDSDGSWSEGGRSASASLSGVPEGPYYLRVEPEMEKDGRAHRCPTRSWSNGVNRPISGFWSPFLALLIPPVFTMIRAFSFENRAGPRAIMALYKIQFRE